MTQTFGTKIINIIKRRNAINEDFGKIAEDRLGLVSLIILNEDVFFYEED